MNDRRLETIIGRLLQAGVLLAAAMVTIGGVSISPSIMPTASTIALSSAGGPDTRTFAGIVRSAAHFESLGIIQFGLLLLIATPVARVALAMVGFALERDRLYTVVSVIVLVILLASLLHAT